MNQTLAKRLHTFHGSHRLKALMVSALVACSREGKSQQAPVDAAGPTRGMVASTNTAASAPASSGTVAPRSPCQDIVEGSDWKCDDLRHPMRDLVVGAEEVTAHSAMETARPQIRKCVEHATGTESELTRRVRVRAEFNDKGTFVDARFHTLAAYPMGETYGLLDKHHHICILHVLSKVHVRSETGATGKRAKVLVTHTYNF